MKSLVIIDGSHLAFRNGFAPSLQGLTSSDGTPTGLIYGFLRSLLLLDHHTPTYQKIVVWDQKDVRRTQLYPEYKANRKKTDQMYSFYGQIDTLKRILSDCGIVQAYATGCEADDVAATLAYRTKGRVALFTGDDDYLQLIDDGRVSVIKPGQSSADPFVFVDRSFVFDKYGVFPEDLVCLRAFLGDSSDNIPGVPRIPRAKISSWVHHYKTIDAIYAALDQDQLDVTPLLRDKMQAFRSNVYRNQELMTLRRDVVVEQLPFRFDAKLLDNWFNALDFNSFTSKISSFQALAVS